MRFVHIGGRSADRSTFLYINVLDMFTSVMSYLLQVVISTINQVSLPGGICLWNYHPPIPATLNLKEGRDATTQDGFSAGRFCSDIGR